MARWQRFLIDAEAKYCYTEADESWYRTGCIMVRNMRIIPEKE